MRRSRGYILFPAMWKNASMTRRWFPLFLLPLSLVAQQPGGEALAALKSCTACHNAAMAQGKLRLDTLESIARGGLSGPVIVPGQSGASLLLKRATSTESAMRMPPAGAMLDAGKVAAIESWIDAGAPGLPRCPTGQPNLAA